MVHPLEKGIADYRCGKPLFADGWCKLHHPTESKKKKLEERERRERGRIAMELSMQSKISSKELNIENAIVLLVQNGYRVELVNPMKSDEK